MIVRQIRSIPEFFKFINDRHWVYCEKTIHNKPGPWIKDPILTKYKFTNVFRQLDKGTIYLNNMCYKCLSEEHTLFNVVWYRIFNWYEHALYGPFDGMDDLRLYFMTLAHDKKVFTSAHMTSASGCLKGSKKEVYLDVISKYNFEKLYDCIDNSSTMEEVFNSLLKLRYIGKFIAYEIVCDLRFLLPTWQPTDIYTWANLGPGANRGLERLGLIGSLKNMVMLYEEAPKYLKYWIRRNYPGLSNKNNKHQYPPFELREIEHSLCEFDKYCRAQEGKCGLERYKG